MRRALLLVWVVGCGAKSVIQPASLGGSAGRIQPDHYTAPPVVTSPFLTVRSVNSAPPAENASAGETLRSLGLEPVGSPVEWKIDERGPSALHDVNMEAGTCLRAVALVTTPESEVLITCTDEIGHIVAASDGLAKLPPASGALLVAPYDGVVCAKKATHVQFAATTSRGSTRVIFAVGRAK